MSRLRLKGKRKTHNNPSKRKVMRQLRSIPMKVIRTHPHNTTNSRRGDEKKGSNSGHPFTIADIDKGGWEIIYNSKEVAKVIRMPLIHRLNRFGELQNLYVRDCYEELYQKAVIESSVEEMRNEDDRNEFMFFTGTPGVGTSIYRNYVVWRMIQDAKRDGSSCIIVLARSPKSFEVHYLRIENGQIADIKSAESIDNFKIYFKKFSTIPKYIHYDVSNGDQSAYVVGIDSPTISFFYTSPNEGAWKELIKMNSIIAYLPRWSVEELVDYYIKMGCNGVLVNNLIVASRSLTDNTPTNVPEKAKFICTETTDDHICLRGTGLELDMDLHLEIPRALLGKVVEDEVRLYGCEPANIFLNSIKYSTYSTVLQRAISDFRGTGKFADYNLLLRKNIRHIFLALETSRSSDGKYDFLEATSAWVSSYAVGLFYSKLARSLQLYTRGTNLPHIFTKIWSKANLKYFEIAYILAFRMSPSAYCVEQIYPHFEDPDHRNIYVKDISKIDANRPTVLRLNGTSLLTFAVNIDVNLGPVAVPIDSLYMGIDAIAHMSFTSHATNFEWENGTIFLQVIISRKHDFKEKATAANLKRLVSQIKAVDCNRFLAIFWVVPSRDFSIDQDIIRKYTFLKQFIVYSQMGI